ncbi:MAG: flotillin family protein [Armatimonadetes bacterium]|nr:flotillin family protein [Armatimonadota bacterium]
MPESLSGSVTWTIMGAGGIVLLAFFVIWIWSSCYRKVGPNEVLIVSGKKHWITDKNGERQKVGCKVVQGGGCLVWPIVERCDTMSLELITLDIVTPEFYTKMGVPVKVDGVAQIKIKGDEESIRTAAEQFLSKSREEILSVALQMMAGHLRGILGTLTVEDLLSGHEAFAQRVAEVTATDLNNMGLTVVSFTIRDITDSHGYLAALGKPRTAQVLRDAQIGEAEAKRDATIKAAQAEQEGQTAKLAADTKIAEANRDYNLQIQSYNASVSQKKAESDLSYDLQKFKTAQLVKAEEVQVEIISKQKQTTLQEQEILRREKELVATVQKSAEAERQKIQTLAEAEQYRMKTTALGQAEATKMTGLAQAEVVKVSGLAEAEAAKAKGLAGADVVQATGYAEAEAMAKKAEAWKQYNEAAITQLFLEKLPEIATAIASPLAKVDKVVIVSQGDGDGIGASKLTGEVTKIITQLPPVVEAMTGVDLSNLVSKVAQKNSNAEEAPIAAGPPPRSDG